MAVALFSLLCVCICVSAHRQGSPAREPLSVTRPAHHASNHRYFGSLCFCLVHGVTKNSSKLVAKAPDALEFYYIRLIFQFLKQAARFLHKILWNKEFKQLIWTPYKQFFGNMYRTKINWYFQAKTIIVFFLKKLNFCGLYYSFRIFGSVCLKTRAEFVILN